MSLSSTARGGVVRVYRRLDPQMGARFRAWVRGRGTDASERPTPPRNHSIIKQRTTCQTNARRSQMRTSEIIAPRKCARAQTQPGA